MDKDVELLKDCIENRAPILLLGAGFSLDAKGKSWIIWRREKIK